MLKYFLLLFLYISVWKFYGAETVEAAKFPARSNVYFIVDASTKTNALNILKNLIDGISLTKYRIAAYTTNGYSSGIQDFKSKHWLLEDIRELNTAVNMTMTQALNKARKNAGSYFLRDRNIFVAVSSKKEFVKHSVDYYIDVTKQNIQLKDFEFYQENLNTCSNEGKVASDECKRVCQCTNGTMTNCYRLRTEWNLLSTEERLYFINAYKELRYNKRFHEKFVQLHLMHPTIDLSVAHSFDNDFIFHRIYVLTFEHLLRLVDCSITIPYWNFLLNGGKNCMLQTSSHHIWDNVAGFGNTKTSLTNGYCVDSGEFKYPQWQLPIEFQEQVIKNPKCQLCLVMSNKECKEFTAHFNPKCVTRRTTNKTSFHLASYEEAYIKLLNTSNFKEYFYTVRPIHTPIHTNMGGVMGNPCATFDPVFFPVHSMVDALYDWWQHRGRKFQNFHKYDNKTKIIGFNTLRKLYIDNDNLGYRNMKIKYTPIF